MTVYSITFTGRQNQTKPDGTKFTSGYSGGKTLLANGAEEAIQRLREKWDGTVDKIGSVTVEVHLDYEDVPN